MDTETQRNCLRGGIRTVSHGGELGGVNNQPHGGMLGGGVNNQPQSKR